MNERQRIAHHEAAHAIVALQGGMGLSAGIDLGAASSVPGTFGNVGANLFEPDGSLPESEQQNVLMWNLAVICAGAASDAKIEGKTQRQALEDQPGDHAVAQSHALIHPIVVGGLVEGAEEQDLVLSYLIGLAQTKVARLLDKAEIWAAIERVADACIANGGKLSVVEIETASMIGKFS